MTVLPTIGHAPRSLQPRAATGHGLSGSAIAGIIIGCIAGVLLLLAIFWTCLLGRHTFTKAKNASTSVVDKAEKGHARAKDENSVGREQRIQPLSLQDGTQSSDSNSELQNESVNSVSHTLEFSVPRRTREKDTGCRSSRSPVCVPWLLVEAISENNASDRSASPSSFPRDEKPVVVDQKRILGIDDASYLARLPPHYRMYKQPDHNRGHEAEITIGEEPWTIVARIRLGARVRTQFTDTRDSRGRMDLRSPRSLILRDQDPNYDASSDYIGYCQKAEVHTFATGTASDEYIRYYTPETCESDLTVGVNPWDVEHQPNPVIFSHFSTSDMAIPEQNTDDSIAFAPSSEAVPSSGEVVGMSHPYLNSVENLPALHASSATPDLETLMTRQSINVESSVDTIPTLKSSTSDFPVNDISPVTTSEDNSPSKGKGPHLDTVETIETMNFAAIEPANQSSNSFEAGTTVASSLNSHTRKGGSAVGFPSQASPLSSPPPSVSMPAKTLVSFSATTEASTDTAFPCPMCQLSFRTAGLRRYVV